jgi:hypothetical protein
MFGHLNEPDPIQFFCPKCSAEYKIIVAESPEPERGNSACLRCSERFPSVGGRVFLKYIPVEHPKPR